MFRLRVLWKHAVLVLVVIGLLLIAAPAFAQGGGDTPPPLSDIEQQGQQVLASIFEIVRHFITLPFAAGIVTLLTSLFKRLLPDAINANVLNFALTAVVWFVYVIAVKLGIDPANVEMWTRQLTKILESVVVLLPFIGGSYAVARVYYDTARKTDMPVIGWQRPGTKGAWRGLHTMLFGPVMKG